MEETESNGIRDAVIYRVGQCLNSIMSSTNLLREFRIVGDFDFRKVSNYLNNVINRCRFYNCGKNSYQLDISLRGEFSEIIKFSIYICMDNNSLYRFSLHTPQGYISYEPSR